MSMKQIEANNYQQLKKELDSKNIDVDSLGIVTSIKEGEEDQYHVLLIKSRPDSRNNKFNHTATVQVFNATVFERIERNIGNGFSHVGLLHDPRKESASKSENKGDSNPNKPKNVGEMVELIKTINDPAELEEILKKDNRSGVVKAVNERLEELVKLESEKGNGTGEGKEPSSENGTDEGNQPNSGNKE